MRTWLAALIVVCAFALPLQAQDKPVQVKVNWDELVRVSRSYPSLQVVVNPPLRRGSAIHDRVFGALKELGADYVRFVPWLPYPRLGVAELEPPTGGKTSWDFSLIDPLTIDFLEATKGHPIILNFSTIPQWMFKTPQPVKYPDDPDQVTWNYTQGREFRDPSLKEVADYYARLASWYTQGGFTDEAGRRHESGYHYAISYWEVLNEVDFEHNMSPETYTRVYDAVVEAVRRVSPQTKFVGLALAMPGKGPQYFEYFLDHKNHRPGVPLDMISYHFYASPTADQPMDVQQFTYWDQADRFLDTVRYIEAIRQRLSPETASALDELGAIAEDTLEKPHQPTKPIPNSYWNLCGAMYAYLFGELSKMGIEMIGESQLVGYPTQFPTVTMVDWNTGQPNARFWVLKLLHDHFLPGDKLVSTNSDSAYVYALGFATRRGRDVLLVNKRDRPFAVQFPGAKSLRLEVVDQTTAFQPARSARVEGDTLQLPGLAVAVVGIE